MTIENYQLFVLIGMFGIFLVTMFFLLNDLAKANHSIGKWEHRMNQPQSEESKLYCEQINEYVRNHPRA